MKKYVILMLIVFVILLLIAWGLNLKKINADKEYFGFGLILVMMNIREVYMEDSSLIDNYHKNIFENTKTSTLFDLVSYINNNSQNILSINKNILTKFKLEFLNINKHCFVYSLNLSEIDNSFEPKKSQYITNFGKTSYLSGDSCKKGKSCFFIFTEKGILTPNQNYLCK